MRAFSPLSLLLLFGFPALPAQDLDLELVARDLNAIFERPEGQPIPPEAQDKFRSFFAKYEGVDLGPLSYARALSKYLLRDYKGAVVELDRFFERYDRIENPEHSTMAGRIYLNAVGEEAKRPDQDSAKLNLWAEATGRLYLDTRVTALYLGQLLDQGTIADPVSFRIALQERSGTRSTATHMALQYNITGVA